MSPLDTPAVPAPTLAAAARPRGAEGRLWMGWRDQAGTTRLSALEQQTPYRLFRPRVPADEPPLAVLANVSGGIVGGDRLDLCLTLDEGAGLTVTGQAAEKVYRAGGRTARLSARIALAAGARLDWLPQGTILFDDVRLQRTTEIELAPDARLLFGECLVFGRRHMGEQLRQGLVDDRLTVSIEGRTLLVDRFRLEDPPALLADPFGLDGADAAALAVIQGPEPEALLEAVRAAQQAAAEGAAGGMESLRWGATRRGPLLLARWLGRDAAVLRRALGRFWQAVRAPVCGFPPRLPAIWAI